MSVKDVFLTNLKEMIADKNMSFRAFSIDIGIHARTMGRWYFDRSPNCKSVVKIADYFNCSVDYLLDRTDKPEFVPTLATVSFYERFTLLKDRNKFSNHFIAKQCEIRPSGMVRWKNGTIPEFEVMVKLCDVFCCSFDYLVGRSDN